MITKEDALQQFKNIVGTKASWANLLKSQFLNHFSIFMSWALRQAFWVVERVFQEIFLSTAVNESSVRAHAEDREYIPRKAVPASGTVNIANKGEYPVVIPAGTSFFSDTNEFLAEDPVSIAAVGNKDANVRQATRQTLEHAVSEEKRFYEILLDLDVTARLASYSVKIDEAGDGIFEDMSYSRLFANAAENDLVYDEFFKHTGQTGIRFGNGIFGKIPPVGAVVRVEMELTEGDTYLIAGETLDQAGTLLDTEGNPASLEIVTVTPVANGVEMEHGDELKANLHYWPLYNELLIWAEDYRFFCRKRYPKILWFKAWGEEEQEAEAGAPSLDYINKVFISAYEKNQHQGDWEADTEYKVWDTVSITGGTTLVCIRAHTSGETEPNGANENWNEYQTLEDRIIGVLSGYRETRKLNRRFEWVDPTLTAYTLAISGKIARHHNLSTVRQDILEALAEQYGIDSEGRRDLVLVKDLYALVNATGFFAENEAYFEIASTGLPGAPGLGELVYIDIDGTTVELEYLQ